MSLCLLQVEFRGPGQGMTGDWVAAAQDWGRRSRGATVRLASLGEVSRDMCQQAEIPVLRESLTSESLCPHKVSVLREFMSSESLCAQRVSVLRESLSSDSLYPQEVSVLREFLSSKSLYPQRVSILRESLSSESLWSQVWKRLLSGVCSGAWQLPVHRVGHPAGLERGLWTRT